MLRLQMIQIILKEMINSLKSLFFGRPNLHLHSHTAFCRKKEKKVNKKAVYGTTFIA
jgi:hypothetical protein